MDFHSPIVSNVSRRNLLRGLASIAAMTALPHANAFAKSPEITNFLKISSVLCGLELDRSYILLGYKIWYAITHKANAAEQKEWQRLLSELSRLPLGSSEKRIKDKLRLMGTRYTEKASLIAKVWYTGRIWQDNGTKEGTFDVIDYDDALVWRACSFTKPPVTCGGHFGYWQHPYTGEA